MLNLNTECMGGGGVIFRHGVRSLHSACVVRSAITNKHNKY